MKKIILIIALIIVIGLGIYLVPSFTNNNGQKNNSNNNNNTFDIQGMKVEILKEGSGPEAKAGDKVYVHYAGTLENGTKFDSSIDRNQPFDFTLGENKVIEGWELGVLGMKAGEKRKLTIPPDLAYGNNSIGLIPSSSTLIFEVELLEIKPAGNSGNSNGGLTVCLDQCGNGICEQSDPNCGKENSLNCICLESKQDCPQDCK